MALSYRADIDGLRAVAVLAVLLFHAGVPGVSGGYVGVDVFFVISGYLITAILRREAESGRWSIARFYERRVRRILPALIVMSIATVLLAGVFLLPSMNRDVPRQALSALGFVANIHFWLSSGYFAPAAETKPLLHTWSLGVEEQFYIFMPLIVLAIARFARGAQLAVLAGLALLSFGLCVALTPRHPEASFYLLPMRAWELLAGSLLTYLPARGGRVLNEALASAGLALLGFAIFAFDASTSFPGWYAALPVVGTALLIHAAPGTFAGRLLSTPLMVGVGLISYSLYLWHWPIVVFARSGGFDPGPAGPVVVLCLSLLLGTLSWRFIEQPFRNRQAMPARKLLAATAVGAIAVFAAASVLRAAHGNFGRFEAQALAYDRARFDISPLRLDCHLSAGIDRPGGYCKVGQGTKGEVTVWADSHGVELSSALAALGYRVTVITYSSCPPALGYARAERPDCEAHNDSVLAALGKTDGEGPVVLAAFYPVLDGKAVAGIVAAANALAAAGREVVLVGSMPSPEVDVPTHLAFGRDPSFARPADTLGEALAGLDPRVRVIRPADIFCRDGACSMLADGAPLLFDDNHPSLAAAKLIAARLPSATGLATQQ